MAFSRIQQAYHYRPMVQAAWEEHCRTAVPAPPLKDKLARERWYREQLHACLGVWTTKQCNPRFDFDKLMAHFEALTGAGIKWQLKLEGGNTRRMIHTIRAICAEHDLDEQYVRGVAAQALKLDRMPPLEELETAQLLTLIKLLRRDAARLSSFQHAGAGAAPAHAEEGDPF